MKNVQSNVFTLVTQTSALAASFQEEGWAEQPAEDKSYAYKQLGHTLGQIFGDVIGFQPTILN